MSDAPKIEERENGPLLVRNVPVLHGSDGTEIEGKPVMALCRCGGSSNKPFCDGSHAKNGFQSRGGTPAGKDRILTYEGTEVTVTYNPQICSHAAECGRLASHIFNPAQKPWVQPDKGSVDEVRAVIAACPSGALALAGTDDREHLVSGEVRIVVEADGPYWVQGIPAPADPQAEGMCGDKYVLCRCGLSGSKPYCDGTHRDKGWRAD